MFLRLVWVTGYNSPGSCCLVWALITETHTESPQSRGRSQRGSVLFRDSGNSKHPPSGQSSSSRTGNRIISEWVRECVIVFFCWNIFFLCECHYLISSGPFLLVVRTHKGWLMEGLPLKPTPGYFLFIYIECKDGSEHNGAALWKVAIQLFNKAVKRVGGTTSCSARDNGT